MSNDEIHEDISGRILSILGTATHAILEHGGDPFDVMEQRLFATIGGKTFSGQIDRRSPIASAELQMPDEDETQQEIVWALEDYKTISGKTLIYNPDGKHEWEKQLNGYALLAVENGISVGGLSVVAIVRDWSQAQARRDQRFPKQAVIRVPLRLWSYEEQRRYFEERIKLHTQTDIPECTNEERWLNPPTYAVMEYKKTGGFKSKATRVLKTEYDAMQYIMDKGLNAEIVQRDNQPTRCVDNYCLVAQFCQQFQRERTR